MASCDVNLEGSVVFLPVTLPANTVHIYTQLETFTGENFRKSAKIIAFCGENFCRVPIGTVGWALLREDKTCLAEGGNTAKFVTVFTLESFPSNKHTHTHTITFCLNSVSVRLREGHVAMATRGEEEVGIFGKIGQLIEDHLRPND